MITFGQSTYLQKVVDCFNLQDAKPLLIPMNPGNNLSVRDCPEAPDEIKKMRCILYKEAIGSFVDVHGHRIQTRHHVHSIIPCPLHAKPWNCTLGSSEEGDKVPKRDKRCKTHHRIGQHF